MLAGRQTPASRRYPLRRPLFLFSWSASGSGGFVDGWVGGGRNVDAKRKAKSETIFHLRRNWDQSKTLQDTDKIIQIWCQNSSLIVYDQSEPPKHIGSHSKPHSVCNLSKIIRNCRNHDISTLRVSFEWFSASDEIQRKAESEDSSPMARLVFSKSWTLFQSTSFYRRSYADPFPEIWQIAKI